MLRRSWAVARFEDSGWPARPTTDMSPAKIPRLSSIRSYTRIQGHGVGSGAVTPTSGWFAPCSLMVSRSSVRVPKRIRFLTSWSAPAPFPRAARRPTVLSAVLEEISVRIDFGPARVTVAKLPGGHARDGSNRRVFISEMTRRRFRGKGSDSSIWMVCTMWPLMVSREIRVNDLLRSPAPFPQQFGLLLA